MNRVTHSRYLRGQQYRDAANLNARQRLHMRYNTRRTGWFEWVFDQLSLHPGLQVLELGCGPGDLWSENLTRIPPDVRVTLSDFSPGMLAKAASRLSGNVFHFACLDAQQIPFSVSQFDTVIANHMLYHLPDLQGGLKEIQRILKPGGRLYAATNGERHMQEVFALERKFSPPGSQVTPAVRLGFNLENGCELLMEKFTDVSVLHLEGSLDVTEAEPLVDYILSMSSIQIPADQRSALNHFIQTEMDRQGGIIHITTDAGLFTAVKPAT